MSKKHHISWLNTPGYKGETLNPIIGCTPASEGCKNCYARGLHNMRHKAYLDGKMQNYPQFARPFHDIQYLPERIKKAKSWKKPHFIFWCDMGDMFHDDVMRFMYGWRFILRILEVMRKTPQHRHIILTKRPHNALKLQNEIIHKAGNIWPDNLLFGVSVSTQEDADRFIPDLLKLDVKTRVVSMEPLLGQVDLLYFCNREATTDERGFPVWKHKGCVDWVIVGGESGKHARPMHPDWARSIQKQCEGVGVPFFFKQWGEFHPLTRTDGIHEAPFGGQAMIRIGRKKAGHLLDGKEYHQWPEVLT